MQIKRNKCADYNGLFQSGCKYVIYIYIYIYIYSGNPQQAYAGYAFHYPGCFWAARRMSRLPAEGSRTIQVLNTFILVFVDLSLPALSMCLFRSLYIVPLTARTGGN